MASEQEQPALDAIGAGGQEVIDLLRWRIAFQTITPDDRATSANALLNFNYQTYDIEIGQSLVLANALTLRLSGGARRTWGSTSR